MLVAVSPVLLLAGLAATSGLTRLLGTGTAARLLGVYLAFLVGWLSISLLLALAYRGLAPERPGAAGAGLGRARHRLGAVRARRWATCCSSGIELPIGEAYGGAVPSRPPR